jgi:hypothetical protein
MDKNSIRPWGCEWIALSLGTKIDVSLREEESSCSRKDEKITGKRRMDDTGPSRHQGAF